MLEFEPPELEMFEFEMQELEMLEFGSKQCSAGIMKGRRHTTNSAAATILFQWRSLTAKWLPYSQLYHGARTECHSAPYQLISTP